MVAWQHTQHFSPERQFGRKNQHQFHFASLLHAGFRVEENAVGADVASLRRVVRPLGRADAGGHGNCDSGSGAALGIGFHRSKVPTYCTPRGQAECGGACPNQPTATRPVGRLSGQPAGRRRYFAAYRFGRFKRAAGTTRACSIVGTFVPRSRTSASCSFSVCMVW